MKNRKRNTKFTTPLRYFWSLFYIFWFIIFYRKGMYNVSACGSHPGQDGIK